MKRITAVLNIGVDEIVVKGWGLTECWAITPELKNGKLHKRHFVLTHTPSGAKIGGGGHLRKDIVRVWGNIPEDVKTEIECLNVQNKLYQNRNLAERFRKAVSELFN